MVTAAFVDKDIVDVFKLWNFGGHVDIDVFVLFPVSFLASSLYMGYSRCSTRINVMHFVFNDGIA